MSDPEGKVTVVVSGTRQLIDVSITSEGTEKEQLEDLLVVLINEAMAKAAEAEARLTQSSIQSMMPPGFDSLTNLFNQ